MTDWISTPPIEWEGEITKRYYTPSIEEIYVGSEIEVLSEELGKWVAETVGIRHSWFGLSKRIESQELRVSYLIGRQLIDDGWTETTTKDNYIMWGIRIFHRGNWMVGLEERKHRIGMTVKDPILVKPEALSDRYTGVCKSINEFRQICKSIEA